MSNTKKIDDAWELAAENPGTPVDIGRIVICKHDFAVSEPAETNGSPS